MTYAPPEGVTIGTFTADTLPASFSAPAGAGISYKIYGTEAGVGTATTEGEPVGYKITLTVNDTPTPIYIGESKLYADEYVDFAVQKVYKKTSNIWNGNVVKWNETNLIEVTDNGNGTFTLSKSDSTTGAFPAVKVGQVLEAGKKYELTCTISGMTSEMLATNPVIGLRKTTNPITERVEITADGTYKLLTDTIPSDASYVFAIILVYDKASVTFSNVVVSDITIKEIVPTDPPRTLPSIITYDEENTISSTETLGNVEFTGEWTAIMGSTEDESIDIEFTVDAEEYIAFVTVDDEPSIQVSDTITMPASASSFTLQVVSWGREQYTDTVYNALS